MKERTIVKFVFAVFHLFASTYFVNKNVIVMFFPTMRMFAVNHFLATSFNVIAEFLIFDPVFAFFRAIS